MAEQGLPSTSNSVFFIEKTVHISNVDARTVFRGCTDLTSQQWNSFTPSFRIKPFSQSLLDKSTHPPQLNLPIGTKIYISIGGFGPIKQRERISRWEGEDEGMCVGWAQDVVPKWMGWLLKSERLQIVTPDAGGDGEGCEYYTSIVRCRRVLLSIPQNIDSSSICCNRPFQEAFHISSGLQLLIGSINVWPDAHKM